MDHCQPSTLTMELLPTGSDSMRRLVHGRLGALKNNRRICEIVLANVAESANLPLLPVRNSNHQPTTKMKIETTKSYIASVNFHGANFTKPEWTFSRTGDATDLDLYSGACVVTGNKGDRDSKEWFIVVGSEIVKVEDEAAAIEAFMFAAKARCAANAAVADPLFKGAAAADAIVADQLKGFFA